MRLRIQVLNSRGIHARSSAIIASLVAGAELTSARVAGAEEEYWADAKRIRSIMTLAASSNTWLVFELHGPEANSVSDKLASCLHNDLFEPDSHDDLEKMVLDLRITEGELLARSLVKSSRIYLERWLASPKVAGDWNKLENSLAGRVASPFIKVDEETFEIVEKVDIPPDECERFRAKLRELMKSTVEPLDG